MLCRKVVPLESQHLGVRTSAQTDRGIYRFSCRGSVKSGNADICQLRSIAEISDVKVFFGLADVVIAAVGVIGHVFRSSGFAKGNGPCGKYDLGACGVNELIGRVGGHYQLQTQLIAAPRSKHIGGGHGMIRADFCPAQVLDGAPIAGGDFHIRLLSGNGRRDAAYGDAGFFGLGRGEYVLGAHFCIGTSH